MMRAAFVAPISEPVQRAVVVEPLALVEALKLAEVMSSTKQWH